jgi:hypothetical protein
MALTLKQLEYQRQWRKENPEQYKEQQKRTRQYRNERINSDPEKFVNYTYSSLAQGAGSRGYAFNLSKKQLRNLLFENKTCALSGRELVFQQKNPNKASVDRINNRLGYSVKNCQIVSSQINRHRLDLSVEEFIKMCCEVAAYQEQKSLVDGS